MNSVQQIIKRAVEEAGQLATRTSGELLMEVARRLPPNAEIKLYKNKVRVQHCLHLDNLMSADSIDDALASNLEMFS